MISIPVSFALSSEHVELSKGERGDFRQPAKTYHPGVHGASLAVGGFALGTSFAVGLGSTTS